MAGGRPHGPLPLDDASFPFEKALERLGVFSGEPFSTSPENAIVSMQSVTTKNLTEIEPSRKSAAAPKAPFEVVRANRLTRT
jgi:hypothetical protein